MVISVPSELLVDIEKLIADGKAVLGAEQAIKLLKQGRLKAVLVASNCPEQTKRDAKYYCSISAVEFEELLITNEDLGTVCKKPFSVSVISILK